MKILMRYVLSALILIVIPASLSARVIEVRSALGTDILEANKSQKAFLKVSLKGFPIDNPQERPPLNIAIVLDRSGSMAGDKLARAKEAAIMAINRLSKKDIVAVVTYDSVINVIVPATKITDKASINRIISQISSGGSTALFAGVTKGAQEVRKFIADNQINRVVLISDGQANVGPQSPKELGALGVALSKEGMSVTTIGLGLGYNEDLMAALAGYSDGNHAFVEKAGDLVRIFDLEFGDAFSVVAKDVSIEIHCQNGVKPLRILGREGDIIGSTVKMRLNQLYGEQEKFVLIEVSVPSVKAGSAHELASVDVSYLNLQENQTQFVSDSVNVRYSSSQPEVIASKNKEVLESSVQQIAIEKKKQAIDLRDKGDVSGAKRVLEAAAQYIQQNAINLGSSGLLKEALEAKEDADALEDASDWNRQRKSLKARSYKLEKQQSY